MFRGWTEIYHHRDQKSSNQRKCRLHTREKMFDSQFYAFALVAALLTLVPGADTMLVIRNVIRGGQRDGVLTTVGICSGLYVHATLSAIGVSMILMHSAGIFQMVKASGACYLIWLGLQSIRSGVRYHAQRDENVKTGKIAPSLRQCFLEGFFTNILNPKVAAFYLAFLPQFIGPTDPVMAKSILLAGVHCIMGLMWLILLSTVLARARYLMAQSSIRRWLDGLCGVVLVGFGLRLLFDE